MHNSTNAQHLTKRYGDHTVVDDLSFTIPTGSVVGLIGPNGAGKTTMMKMLLGLVTPTSGEIKLLGTQVGSRGWGQTLKRVGSMIEEPPIYRGMTARQNLEYQSIAINGRVDTPAIDAILRLIDLADRADDKPRAYSLGMRQRLGIGITLIGDPDLVILDEPTNGLDPAGIIEIRHLLQRLPENGTTVLVSSHQLAEVEQACDRLVVIADGRLVAENETKDILAAGVSNEFNVSVDSAETAGALELCRNAGFSVTDYGAGKLVVEPLPGVGGREINRLLAESGIYVANISRRTVSLEEAFLQLVSDESSTLDGTTAEGVSA